MALLMFSKGAQNEIPKKSNNIQMHRKLICTSNWINYLFIYALMPIKLPFNNQSNNFDVKIMDAIFRTRIRNKVCFFGEYNWLHRKN